MQQQRVTAPVRNRINRGALYFFGALGGILFGYDLGVVSGALLFIKHDMALNSVMQGLVVGGLAIGAMFGAGGVGRVTDRLGRRRAILISAAIFAVGAIGSALAPNPIVLIAFRLMLGLGVGGSSTVVPIYLSEMAPARMRGALSSLNQLMIVIGILLAYLVDYAFSFSGNWRLMFGLALLPAVVLLVGMYFMPETPRWLLKQGHDEAARTVLRRMREGDVEPEVGEIREILQMEGERRARWRDLGAGWVRPALIVALGLAIGQQFVGTNAINLYAPTIFASLGFGNSASILATVGLGAVKVALTIVTIFLVDRWGRKPLLLIGNVAMSTSLFLLGLVSLLFGHSTSIGATTFIFLMIYLAGYEIGWGAVVWVMLSEIFPLKVRGAGMGVGSVALWAATFAISFVFPIMKGGIGLSYSTWVFAAIGILAFTFVVRFVPETKGRSLEQIEADLMARV